LVTVTGVEVSPDLRHASVYLSSLSEVSAEALSAHRAQLQQAIGRQVRLKRTPQLTFAADPGVVHGNRVEELLRRIRESAEAPSAEPEPGGTEPGGEPGGGEPGGGEPGGGS
jgi:ribosome-binding factor A